MTDQDFQWFYDELMALIGRGQPVVMLTNAEVINRIKALPASDSPLSVDGFRCKIYGRLGPDHVLFFSSTQDAKEFVDACEECIAESPGADPEALVGVIIEISKQRLIKQNTLIDKEQSHGSGKNT